jgi:membrane protease YdiL (CAAX protease family)
MSRLTRSPAGTTLHRRARVLRAVRPLARAAGAGAGRRQRRTHLGHRVVAGSVATTAAGAALCWLRLRSGSLAAPVVAHCATNTVPLTTTWVLTR